MSRPEHDITQLERRITELSNAYTDLGKGETLTELIRIIHFPGFTTVAEWSMITAIVETLERQTVTINTLQRQLVTAATQVVNKEQAAVHRE
jgi:hypothetical protein